MKKHKTIQIILLTIISYSILFINTASQASCNLQENNRLLRPSDGTRFDKVLATALRLQFPSTRTCINNIDTNTPYYIENRWYKSGNNLIFNFPNAVRKQRMELRGKSFTAKTNSEKKQTWEARVRIDTNGSERYTIGQLFAEGDDDAAKLQFIRNRKDKTNGLWLTYARNDSESDNYRYLGKMDSFENIRMRYYRDTGQLTVEFNDELVADITIDGYHNTPGQMMYYKAGVYFQRDGNGRAEFSKLNF